MHFIFNQLLIKKFKELAEKSLLDNLLTYLKKNIKTGPVVIRI